MLISNKLSETQPKEPKHIDVIPQTNSYESNLRLVVQIWHPNMKYIYNPRWLPGVPSRAPANGFVESCGDLE